MHSQTLLAMPNVQTQQPTDSTGKGRYGSLH